MPDDQPDTTTDRLQTDITTLPNPIDPPPPIHPETKRFNLSKPAPDDPRRCTAHSKSTGNRCDRWAISGGTICAYHGGNAPQVRAKAQQRLERAALPAAGYMAKAIRRKGADNRTLIDGVGLAAADKILNRVLGVPGQTLTVQGADGGPLRVIHQYAQLTEAEALSLPEADVIDAETVPAAEPQAPAAGPAGRRFGF